MGDDKPRSRGSVSVTTGVNQEASEKEPESSNAAADLQERIEKAESEAAEAEAAASAARARVRAIRGDQDDESEAEVSGDRPHDRVVSDSARRPWYRPRLRGARWTTIAKAVGAIVIVVSLAGSGFIVWQHGEASARSEHAAEAIDFARQGVTALTTLDFNHAREDVQRIIDSSTGAYRDDFLSRAEDFINVVEASKAVTQGSVSAIGVESMTDDEAVVLVSVEEKVTNAAGAKEDPRRFRFRVTIVQDGEQLKMSRVEMVP